MLVFEDMKHTHLPTISVCVSVNNEAKRIQELMESLVGFADEVIISDTGSLDDTPAMVEAFIQEGHPNFHLHHYVSVGGFHYGKAKNYAMSKATKDYILVLDADERLSKDFTDTIKEFLHEHNPDVVKIVRYDDLLPHLVEPIERIVKREKKIFFGTDDESKVHEFFIHSSKAITFHKPLWHCQREKHWLLRPHSRFFYLGLEVDRTPKTKSFFGHFLRGLWMFQYKFTQGYFSQGMKHEGLYGFEYAFLRAVYAFLIQFFVGLKQEDNEYWTTPEYRERIH